MPKTLRPLNSMVIYAASSHNLGLHITRIMWSST